MLARSLQVTIQSNFQPKSIYEYSFDNYALRFYSSTNRFNVEKLRIPFV